MLKNKIENTLTRKKRKKNQGNSDKFSRLGLIIQTRNPWKSRPWFNKRAQFLTNLMLEDEIIKKSKLKNLPKQKKIATKNMETNAHEKIEEKRITL